MQGHACVVTRAKGSATRCYYAAARPSLHQVTLLSGSVFTRIAVTGQRQERRAACRSLRVRVCHAPPKYTGSPLPYHNRVLQLSNSARTHNHGLSNR